MNTLIRERLSVEDRRAQLLRFGRIFFANNAFDAFSMSEMAKEAGVSKALIYHYFGGRRGFYLATIEAVATELTERLVLSTDVPLVEALDDMLLAFIRYVKDNGDIYLALIRGGLGSDPEVNQLVQGVRAAASQSITCALGLGEPTPLGGVVMSGALAFVEQATAEWLGTPEVDEDSLKATLVKGVVALLPLL